MIATALAVALLTIIPQWHSSMACASDTLLLRGKPQHLHLCGNPHDRPVILASGDGGWIHLAPHVAEVLAAEGHFVIGLDAKAYLAGFTDTTRPLTTADVAADFANLVSYAARNTGMRPILAGVSEGAALAVVAAASDAMKSRVGGVVTLGLGDVNELAWRWRDSIIYLTKRAPDEPSFRSSEFIEHVSPVPIAMIQSTVDEYVPLAEGERLAALAKEPKRCWTIAASDHAFSGNRPLFDARLIEAMKWMIDVESVSLTQPSKPS